jgi:hypothetical protein
MLPIALISSLQLGLGKTDKRVPKYSVHLRFENFIYSMYSGSKCLHQTFSRGKVALQNILTHPLMRINKY